MPELYLLGYPIWLLLGHKHVGNWKLHRTPQKSQQRPGPGLCKGMITIIADDEDHLKDFEEYM